jgi:hypothetical protein
MFEIFSFNCSHGLIFEFKERRLFEIKSSSYRKVNTTASPLNIIVVELCLNWSLPVTKIFGIIHILCGYSVEILIVDEVDRSYSGI